MSRQHGRIQLDVEPLAAQCVVDRVAGETGLSFPQLDQFLYMGFQHVVAEYPGKTRNELLAACGFEQGQRPAVHLDDPDLAAAALHAGQVGQQESAQVGDAFAPPLLELVAHAAVVFQP
jgi:hypothetical protein